MKKVLFFTIIITGFNIGACRLTIAQPQVLNEEFPGKVRLILPKTIYAVSGLEMNVYFDNVILVINPANFAFDVTCKKGIQQAERWTYVPSASDVGDYPFQIEVRDSQNKVIARAKSTLRVVPANAGAGLSITQLCIGDSLTHHSVYTGHLLELCNKLGNPHLNLIGTHHPYENLPAENRHEGYGGWTTQLFATCYTGFSRKGNYSKRGSPFLYLGIDNKPKLDFSRYLHETNQGKAPDVVTIFLGCNDIFYATDENIEQVITIFLGFYDTLINMVHSTDKKTKIGIVLIPSPAASQDAFGSNYGCGQTRWQYKRNQHRAVERLMQHYGNREKENIFLIPVFINLDCEANGRKEKVCRNAQTSQITIRQNNGVHPADEGYRQIGDTFYCWLKLILIK